MYHIPRVHLIQQLDVFLVTFGGLVHERVHDGGGVAPCTDPQAVRVLTQAQSLLRKASDQLLNQVLSSDSNPD